MANTDTLSKGTPIFDPKQLERLWFCPVYGKNHTFVYAFGLTEKEAKDNAEMIITYFEE